MGRPNFGRSVAHPTPLVAHTLHDDDVNVLNGDVAEGSTMAYLLRLKSSYSIKM